MKRKPGFYWVKNYSWNTVYHNISSKWHVTEYHIEGYWDSALGKFPGQWHDKDFMEIDERIIERNE